MSGGISRLARLASFLLDSSRSSFPENQETSEPVVASSNTSRVEQASRDSDLFAGCLVNGNVASHNAWRWQVDRSDPELLCQYPRLTEVMGMLNQSVGQRFDLCVSRSKLSSHVLEHCLALLQGLQRKGVSRFKIGITVDPYNRWFCPEYGYATDGVYGRMLIVAILRTMEAAAFLEAFLIREFRSSPGCDNSATGGEGVSVTHTNLAFVYVVVSWPTVGNKRPRLGEQAS